MSLEEMRRELRERYENLLLEDREKRARDIEGDGASIMFKWWENVWLDVYADFNGCKADLKAQRGGNQPRDAYFEPQRGSSEWHRLFIEEVYMTPRRQGCGTKFFKLLEKELCNKGFKSMGAEVTEDAVPFFKAIGWRADTDPPTWEETNWGPALAMFKDLRCNES